MKKRAIKLLALTLVAIMTFFAVGCDMDAIDDINRWFSLIV